MIKIGTFLTQAAPGAVFCEAGASGKESVIELQRHRVATVGEARAQARTSVEALNVRL
jgi:hypothetical protein